MFSPRWTLIISTIFSTLTLLILIISLPLFFNRMLKSNSLMLSQLSICQIESHSLIKELSKVQHLRKSRQVELGSCCSCQQGAAGEAGPRGREGEDGRPGRIGVNGRNGKDGRYIDPPPRLNDESCQKCPPSPPGAPGDPGPKGPRGPPGKSGIPGIAGKGGRKGPPGPEGIRGVPGSIGRPGARGDRGKVLMGAPQGPPGPVGPVGPRGKPGLDGREGRPGNNGINGDRGGQGMRGRAGETGSIGTKGPKGPIGLPGSCAHCASLERPAYPVESNEPKNNTSSSPPSHTPTLHPLSSTSPLPSSTSTVPPSTTHMDYDYNDRIYETPEEHIHSIPHQPKHGYESKEIEKYYENSREVTQSPSSPSSNQDGPILPPRDQSGDDVQQPPTKEAAEPTVTTSTPEYGGSDGSFIGYGGPEEPQPTTDYSNQVATAPSHQPTVYSNPNLTPNHNAYDYGSNTSTPSPQPKHETPPSPSAGYESSIGDHLTPLESTTLPHSTIYEQEPPSQPKEDYSGAEFSTQSIPGNTSPQEPSTHVYNPPQEHLSHLQETHQEPTHQGYSTPENTPDSGYNAPREPQTTTTRVYEIPSSPPRSTEDYGGSEGSFAGYGGPESNEDQPRTIPGIRIDQSQYKSEEVYSGPSYPSIPLSLPSTPSPSLHPSSVPSPSIPGYDSAYESYSHPSSQYSSNPLPSYPSYPSPSPPPPPPRASVPTVPSYSNIYPAMPQYPPYRNTFSFPQLMNRELVYPPPGHNSLPANYQAYRAVPRSGWKIEGAPNRQFVPSI